MSERRKVRGLLEINAAEMSGEEWELENPSPDFVPGMGLGATKQATRWAWIGMQHEILEQIKRISKRPAHRPRKHPFETKDAIRAFSVWFLCKNLRHNTLNDPTAQITTRELIRLVQIVERELAVPRSDWLFNLSDQQNEQSVSRGKGPLDIDDDWNSLTCEELLRTFPQVT